MHGIRLFVIGELSQKHNSHKSVMNDVFNHCRMAMLHCET